MIKVVFVQLGSPKNPSISKVRKFLREFLGDPRVVDVSPFLWKIILNCFVLPFRPSKSAKLYKRIWDGEKFLLGRITQEFTNEVRKNLPENIHVETVYLCQGKISWKLTEDYTWIIPLFPQYAECTTAAVFDVWAKLGQKSVIIPPHKFTSSFHRLPAFIQGIARLIKKAMEEKNCDCLVISFHGIPTRRVVVKQDPYYRQCFETFELLVRELNLPREKIHLSFQSRFGSEEWLGPDTVEVVKGLSEKGVKDCAVVCPSFVADCLETEVEIGYELCEEVPEMNIHLVPCLNADKQWCHEFSDWIKDTLEKENIPETTEIVKVEAPKMKSPPLDIRAKKTLKIVFLTLFLDLVGFSIIFPLFPALAKYYLETDGQNFFLRSIFSGVEYLLLWGGSSNTAPLVLFGGALGALYSLLQFCAAPLWGGLSDRVGRKPILLVSVTGLFISYLMWGFAANFTILILARFIGGIMGGNISTATAVVADITQKNQRSKGMAFVGIAFALGFIFGPAIGGIFSLIRFDLMFPQLGMNPFSAPALFAAALSLINIFLIAKNFEETLPEKEGNIEKGQRSINPLKLFRPLPYPGTNLTNFGHFIFLLAFSGMEFTLTFLAFDRFKYSPLDNGLIFIYVGLLLALVQGGFVRRKAHEIGEQKLVLAGILITIPGLLIIGWAPTSMALFAGLFFLSIGAGLVIPCLTALISLYTPANSQGQALGIFRSLGALARVFGPLFACLLYWKMGSQAPYYLGSIVLILPFFLISTLPKRSEA